MISLKFTLSIVSISLLAQVIQSQVPNEDFGHDNAAVKPGFRLLPKVGVSLFGKPLGDLPTLIAEKLIGPVTEGPTLPVTEEHPPPTTEELTVSATDGHTLPVTEQHPPPTTEESIVPATEMTEPTTTEFVTEPADVEPITDDVDLTKHEFINVTPSKPIIMLRPEISTIKNNQGPTNNPERQGVFPVDKQISESNTQKTHDHEEHKLRPIFINNLFSGQQIIKNILEGY